MRKDDSTRKNAARPPRDVDFDEPLRRWTTLPVTRERACELVDLVTRREDPDARDALIELICGLTPHTPTDDKHVLDERFLAGHAALTHAYTQTNRAINELGAYVVHLKCAQWE